MKEAHVGVVVVAEKIKTSPPSCIIVREYFSYSQMSRREPLGKRDVNKLQFWVRREPICASVRAGTHVPVTRENTQCGKIRKHVHLIRPHPVIRHWPTKFSKRKPDPPPAADTELMRAAE